MITQEQESEIKEILKRKKHRLMEDWTDEEISAEIKKISAERKLKEEKKSHEIV